MLSTEERQSKLESLLKRVQKNRRRLDAARPGAAPLAAEIESRAAFQPVSETRISDIPEETISDIPEPSLSDLPEMALDTTPPKPASQGLEAIVMEKVSSEPPPVEETIRQLETMPRASGEVAAMTGTRPKSWTLEAVLDRAWKLGST